MVHLCEGTKLIHAKNMEAEKENDKGIFMDITYEYDNPGSP